MKLSLDNPLIEKIVGSVIRHAATVAGTWIAVQGHLSASDKEQIIGTVIIVLSTLWSNWEKNHSQKQLVTAMASGPTSQVAVNNAIKAGLAPPVTTPKSEVPELKNIVVP